ncbi:MAG: hypothetical protein ACR2ID_07785 [Chthoniobacterales bacterium]
MQQLAPNLWLVRYPLRLLGLEIGRNVTVVRLTSGELVIHSSAPFTESDVQEIAALGEPRWLLDVTRFHDSYARAGRAAFPRISYLAPENFPARAKLQMAALEPAPQEWGRELQLQRIDGMPGVQEHAVFHAPSRTLVVGDLLFHFGPCASWWTKFIVHSVLRLPHGCGMSRFFRLMIRDRTAFRNSLERIMQWDFDRVVVGHGDVIETGGKPRLREVLLKFGLLRDGD